MDNAKLINYKLNFNFYNLKYSSGYLQWRHVIVHELLHLLGVGHEHQRPDRDNYVKIHWENIRRENAYNFFKYVYVSKKRFQIALFFDLRLFVSFLLKGHLGDAWLQCHAPFRRLLRLRLRPQRLQLLLLPQRLREEGLRPWIRLQIHHALRVQLVRSD